MSGEAEIAVKTGTILTSARGSCTSAEFILRYYFFSVSLKMRDLALGAVLMYILSLRQTWAGTAD